MKLKSRISELTFESALINMKNLLIQNKQFELDLSSIRWVDPFGLLFMRLWFEQIMSNNNSLKVIFNEDIVNYIVRMDFHTFFKDNTSIEFIPKIRAINLIRTDLKNKLIELHEFQVNNDDEVVSETDRIIEIVSGRIDHYDKIKDRLYDDLVETISNIQVHSSKFLASVVLQSYGNSIILVVSDDGIGIKEGLKNQGVGLIDEDAIEKSLKERVTGRTGDGGMGLTQIVSSVKKFNDKICIRSKSGYYIIENNESRKGKCMELPGTQIYLKLQC